MICKWLSDDDQEICCNGECPACADFCPCANYQDICRYAEKAQTVKLVDADKLYTDISDLRKNHIIGGDGYHDECVRNRTVLDALTIIAQAPVVKEVRINADD